MILCEAKFIGSPHIDYPVRFIVTRRRDVSPGFDRAYEVSEGHYVSWALDSTGSPTLNYLRLAPGAKFQSSFLRTWLVVSGLTFGLKTFQGEIIWAPIRAGDGELEELVEYRDDNEIGLM